MTRNPLIEAGAISELSVRLRTKIYYTTLHTVHKKSYKDLLLMNDDISMMISLGKQNIIFRCQCYS